MCLYGHYLFINEVNKGFHIIDNADPSLPRPVGFVDLPGNVDLAVKDNLLFADSYVDLVWFDLTQPARPVAVGRLEQAFPDVLPPVDNLYATTAVNPDDGVVVGWKVKTITEKVSRRPDWNYYQNDLATFGDKGGSSGMATMTGSMARFAVHGDYLYAVTNFMLKVFTVSGNTVTKGGEQYLNWNTETIFAYNQKLFLGTTSGLLIYDIANPAAPERLSSLNHVLGCDPVVVQGDYAYVTIRGGNACGQNLSLLDVVDISDPAQPRLSVSYGMQSPYGLGIAGDLLFVCDEGLKVFDATDPLLIGARLLKHFPGINAFDVIPYNNILMLIGNDGLYQYDYSDVQDIKQISVLRIGLAV
jgi:hypothetical protein